jgi:hypothetical protein
LLYRQASVRLSIDHKQTAVEAIGPSILNRGCEHVESVGQRRVHVVKNRSSAKVIGHSLGNILPDGFKQRMAGRNPFESRILGEQLFIEHNFLVLAPQFSESAFESLPNGLERARNFADPVNVAVLCYRAGIDTCNRRSRSEESRNRMRGIARK